MKTITFLLVFIISCDRLYSQYIFPLKEHYDRTHGVYVLSSIDYTNHWSTGNTLSWVLSSYLRMYRATGDKDYLIKFINQTIRIQNARLDILLPLPPPFQFPKKWTANGDTDCDGSECTYFNSLLIYPMAEFVYQIINDPTLYNTNLPLNLIEDENMHPAANIPSYGDFALWLGARVEETFGCDFVFEENYKRPTYTEKEKWFQEKKHLRGIAPAKEIESKGMKAGETISGIIMNVEENSLDIIDLKKENEEQKQEIITLKSENESLKKKQKELELRLKKLEGN